MKNGIDVIEASISFIDRASTTDVTEMLAFKKRGDTWHGRRDIAHVSIGPITVWIDPTSDGRTNIGIYRQFLNRRQRAELKRLNALVVELATRHGIEKLLLAEDGSDPQVEKR